MRIRSAALDELTLMEGNPRRGDIAAVARSLAQFGQRKPVVINTAGVVIAGNHTVLAARQLGWARIEVNEVDDDEATAKAYALADNRTSALGSFDEEDLAAMLAEVQAADPALLAAASYSIDDLAALVGRERSSGEAGARGPNLADRFLVPPFSILDGRAGWWRSRKAAWRELGIDSEAGRGTMLTYDSLTIQPNYYEQKRAIEKKIGRELTNAEFQQRFYAPTDRASAAYGTSVYDPVLAELLYRWFSPPAGLILDPWAGGSVRGLIACLLGRRYLGIDLSPGQVAANYEQAGQVLGEAAEPAPQWIVGDCLEQLPGIAGPADFLIGCPPYFDLEQYADTDDPRDLARMDDQQFAAAYRKMIAAAAARLADDRFAALTVSSVRAKAGGGPLRDLHGLTVDACAEAGLALYNEAILITPAGSLPIRIGRIFTASRGLGRTHQDVLIFVKGDPKAAAAACGAVDTDAMRDALIGAGVEEEPRDRGAADWGWIEPGED